MKVEFYQPSRDFLPTFSLFCAAALTAAFNAQRNSESTDFEQLNLPQSHLGNPYYTNAAENGDQAVEIEKLRRFAGKLLDGATDTPQAAIDAINRCFWDLV